MTDDQPVLPDDVLAAFKSRLGEDARFAEVGEHNIGWKGESAEGLRVSRTTIRYLPRSSARFSIVKDDQLSSGRILAEDGGEWMWEVDHQDCRANQLSVRFLEMMRPAPERVIGTESTAREVNPECVPDGTEAARGDEPVEAEESVAPPPDGDGVEEDVWAALSEWGLARGFHRGNALTLLVQVMRGDGDHATHVLALEGAARHIRAELRRVDPGALERHEDSVNHPTHYSPGPFEVINVLERHGGGPGYALTSAIKYIARAGRKDEEGKELAKALWCIERAITQRTA